MLLEKYFKHPLTSLSVTVRLSDNPIFIGHNVRMTESYINAVISTSARGEISSNKQTSPIVEVTAEKTVIGSEVEVCFH